jgi:hypothetical protein
MQSILIISSASSVSGGWTMYRQQEGISESSMTAEDVIASRSTQVNFVFPMTKEQQPAACMFQPGNTTTWQEKRLLKM